MKTDQDTIRSTGRQTEQASLEVPLVSCQVDEADNPASLHRDLIPAQLLSTRRSGRKSMLIEVRICLGGANMVRWVYWSAVGRKAQDLHPNAASPPSFDLVLVPEQIYTCFSSSIIQRAPSYYAKRGTLSGIDVADHRYSDFDGVFDAIWRKAEQVY